MPKISRAPGPTSPPPRSAPCSWPACPRVATLLTAFGVGDLSAAQQDALSGALTWSAILAGLLIGGDATLRAARNLADRQDRRRGHDGRPAPVARRRPRGPRHRLRGGRGRRRSPTRRSSTPTASCRRSRPRCPSTTPTTWGVTRDEHRPRWDRADQGVRGLPVRRPPVLRQLGGVWTIGYGHTEGVGPHSPRLTERQASELLERDLERRYGAPSRRSRRASPQPEPVRRARRVRLQRRRRRARRRAPGSAGRCARGSGTGPPTRCCAGTRAGDRPAGRRADATPEGGAQALPHAGDRPPARGADQARAQLVPRVRPARSRASTRARTRRPPASGAASCAARCGGAGRRSGAPPRRSPVAGRWRTAACATARCGPARPRSRGGRRGSPRRPPPPRASVQCQRTPSSIVNVGWSWSSTSSTSRRT